MASVFLLSMVAVGIGVFGILKAKDLRDRLYLVGGPIADRTRLTEEVDIHLLDFIRMQKNVILAETTEQREKFIQMQSAIPMAFDQALNDWEQIASDQGKADIQDIRTAFAEYKQMNSEVVALARAGHPDRAQTLSVNRSFEIFARIRKPLDASKKRASDDLARQKDETAALYRNFCWSIGLAVLLGVGTGLTWGWWVVRETALRLNRVRDYVHDVAEGEGDLTKRIQILHEDELGQLGIWINRFLDGIETIIAAVSENTEKIASSASHIAGVTRNIADSSREQNDKTTQVTDSMGQMTTSIAEVSRHSEQAARTAQEAGAAANDGSQTVNNTVEIMREIASSAQESAQAIQELDQSSDQIGKIVAVIDEIAGQTGLLALNAAIEAARAGEQGLGFAVVAGEVRRLAERTTGATKEIGQMIASVQQTTHLAVSAMDESTRKVTHGVEVAQQCSVALEQITSRASDVENMISQIAAAATEQAAATGEMNGSMESIATIVRGSTEEAQESAEACQQLASLADELKRHVSRFKTRAAGASR
jgi:methyl-accepting chemotaxis protein